MFKKTLLILTALLLLAVPLYAEFGGSGGAFGAVWDQLKTCASNIIPNATNTYNLGSSSYYWNNAYITTLNATNWVVADDGYVGLGAAKGRFVFDDTTTDTITWINANMIGGSATVDSGTFSMIAGAQTSDPTFTITQAATAVTLAETVGDITISAVDDIILTPDSANTDTLTVLGDASDLYMKWSDGNLKLATDEGTNTKSTVRIDGKGTGAASFVLSDGSDVGYVATQDVTDTAFALYFGNTILGYTVNSTSMDVDTTIKTKNSATALVVNSDATAASEYISSTLSTFMVGESVTRRRSGGTSSIELSGTSLPAIVDTCWNASAVYAPILEFNRSKGAAIGTHTVVANNDVLGYISWAGSDGAEFVQAAQIRGEVDGTLTGGGTDDMPGRLTFWTSPDGSATPAERMRIDSAGKVFVGGTAGGTTNSDLVSGVTTGSGASHSITILTDTAGKSQLMFGDTLATAGEYDGLLRYDHALRGMEFWSAGVNRLQIDSSGGVQGSVYSIAKQHDEIGILLDNLTAPKAIVGFTGTGATTSTESGYESGAGRVWTYSGGLAADKIFQGSTYVYSFDGVDSYLSTPDTADMSFGDAGTDTAFSVGGWVNIPTTPTSYATIIGKDTGVGGGMEWSLLVQDTNRKPGLSLLSAGTNAAYLYVYATNAVDAGWHFVTTTYDGSKGAGGILVYVDGKAVATTDGSTGVYAGMNATAAQTLIGVRGDSARWWNGSMGRLFVTGEALSAATIWKLYEKTRGQYNK